MIVSVCAVIVVVLVVGLLFSSSNCERSEVIFLEMCNMVILCAGCYFVRKWFCEGSFVV